MDWSYELLSELERTEMRRLSFFAGGGGASLCGHWYYDPGAGRFLNCNPMGMDGGINTYTYCLNNSIQFTDLDGTDVVIFLHGSIAKLSRYTNELMHIVKKQVGGTSHLNYSWGFKIPLVGKGKKSGCIFFSQSESAGKDFAEYLFAEYLQGVAQSASSISILLDA